MNSKYIKANFTSYALTLATDLEKKNNNNLGIFYFPEEPGKYQSRNYSLKTNFFKLFSIEMDGPKTNISI